MSPIGVTKVPEERENDLYGLCNRMANYIRRGGKRGSMSKPGQNRVLKVLAAQKDGTMSAQALRRELDIRSSSLYELLAKLEKDGLVTKEQSNRGGNETEVSITSLGRVLALECQIYELKRDEEFFGCLEDDEREDLSRILTKLLGAWMAESGEGEGAYRERRWREREEEKRTEEDILARLESLRQELS